ncbi:4-(cytidine 5'-diphospho)-2-C-methyl-D-erythritol kinase [Treponema sp.]|uniref:4-(cytidine 5'-diphospho)-2-C-methyl-D-erythritol kinase n=1 Tax=Treponema sp. TaxID=166 RepID=UPI00388E7A24
MCDSITVPAPAKINLGLKVFPKRADGYHDIQSVFQTVRLFDEITVSLLKDEDNTCIVECDSLQLPEENTFTTSYKAFCVLTGIQRGVRVSVKKRIPAGGGLGGGSSDASSFIQSLDNLFGTQLDFSALSELAGKVGSDVFFFTHALNADGKKRFSSFEPYAAYVEGRGEKVRQIECRNDFSVLLVLPGVSVSTKIAYGLVDREHEKNSSNNCSLVQGESLESIYRKKIGDWNFVNDFTVPVAREFTQVADALEKLRDCGALFADMSGSGSTVFGVFCDVSDALKARKMLERYYVTVLS